MYIVIQKTLTAKPKKMSLPATIELSQTLKSLNGNPEVTISYSLNTEHNIFFDENGNLKNSVSFTETIYTTDTPISHNVTLAANVKGNNLKFCEIVQSIDGEVNDSVVIQII